MWANVHGPQETLAPISTTRSGLPKTCVAAGRNLDRIAGRKLTLPSSSCSSTGSLTSGLGRGLPFTLGVAEAPRREATSVDIMRGQATHEKGSFGWGAGGGCGPKVRGEPPVGLQRPEGA